MICLFFSDFLVVWRTELSQAMAVVEDFLAMAMDQV